MGIEYAIKDYGLAYGIIIVCFGIMGMMYRRFTVYLDNERSERQKQSEAYKVLAETHIAHNTEVMQGMLNQIRQMGIDSCREHGEIKDKLK